MAGSEKSGFANAKAHLIENAYYIITPSAKVSEEKVEEYTAFIGSLKALPILLDYQSMMRSPGRSAIFRTFLLPVSSILCARPTPKMN